MGLELGLGFGAVSPLREWLGLGVRVRVRVRLRLRVGDRVRG